VIVVPCRICLAEDGSNCTPCVGDCGAVCVLGCICIEFCSRCGFWEDCFDLGNVTGPDGQPSIVDVLEILMFMVNIESVIDYCDRAWCASLITVESRERGRPGIGDVLEILMFMVGIEGRISQSLS